jgi:hypothetical protein
MSLYEVEGVLSKSPHSVEANILRDDIKKAIRFEMRDITGSVAKQADKKIPSVSKVLWTKRWVMLILLSSSFLIFIHYLIANFHKNERKIPLPTPSVSPITPRLGFQNDFGVWGQGFNGHSAILEKSNNVSSVYGGIGKHYLKREGGKKKSARILNQYGAWPKG